MRYGFGALAVLFGGVDILNSPALAPLPVIHRGFEGHAGSRRSGPRSRYTGAQLREIRATGQARECARRLKRRTVR